MKYNKSVKPTPEYSLKSLSRMDWSWSESKWSTPEPELENISKQKDWVVILDLVKREVQGNHVCPPNCFGSEDREFCEDFWRSTDKPKRSIELFITNSIWLRKVTNTKTVLSLLKLSSRRKPKKLRPRSYRLSRRLEGKRTTISEREKLTRLKSFD